MRCRIRVAYQLRTRLKRPSLTRPITNVDMKPERKEDAVAEQQAEQPQHRHPKADVLVLLVVARQQVPHDQLLGGEALGHLVVDDRLQALARELAHVRQLELALQALAARQVVVVLFVLERLVQLECVQTLALYFADAFAPLELVVDL
ncbi:hypothetical protein BpHYR1_024186 [Brachionus plicatilis]|uniref:Uncharacterized protein n=1 Tax=Brachionus plicatilis TaxID=10195 RepID=A0A3M7SL49_BRAPC|nr:hypothetical protein BpHYR1_024186 [Brachionus plicatilis]